MTKSFIHDLRQAVFVTLALLFLCGFAFPVVLSGLSSVIFPAGAKGNLITVNGEVVGAHLVGQEFTKDYFMKGRPSAYHYNTFVKHEDGSLKYNDGSDYAGLSSGSNNYAPSNPALNERVKADMESFLTAHPGLKAEDIPTDMLTASGSGLDPHISLASAEVQIPTIAKASGISEDKLREIVKKNVEGKFLGMFGEYKVNVLGVNIDIARAMGLIKG